MSRRRWTVKDPANGEHLQVLTLWGDSDDQTRAALLTMIIESIPICAARNNGRREVLVECVEVD